MGPFFSENELVNRFDNIEKKEEMFLKPRMSKSTEKFNNIYIKKFEVREEKAINQNNGSANRDQNNAFRRFRSNSNVSNRSNNSMQFSQRAKFRGSRSSSRSSVNKSRNHFGNRNNARQRLNNSNMNYYSNVNSQSQHRYFNNNNSRNFRPRASNHQRY